MTDFSALAALGLTRLGAADAALALAGAPWGRGRAVLFERQKERVRLAAWRRWLPLAKQRVGGGGLLGGPGEVGGGVAMDVDEAAAAGPLKGAALGVDLGPPVPVSTSPVRFALKALAVDVKGGKRKTGQVHKAFLI